MFGSIKSAYKKSQAEELLSKVLVAHDPFSQFNGEQDKVASNLIENVWNARPNIFSGKEFGERPNTISILLFALANGLELEKDSTSARNIYIMCMSSLFQEVEERAGAYKLVKVDDVLITASLNVFEKHTLKNW
ncbi:hypothetical protein [Thiomicrorhabdus sp. 6S3-12]|uniref:hypothetical protein n=1 Tax=Thiomicrorhabdus sp. 6S3-12 TaxID=2819681 RepID=UPI001AADCBD6|nr:hypothetical protein [Thiomicrorhabdus sp. 6S3-12]MBO1924575.1 hypothetical protein [Thiomicrorhabdus sp. 6S3-12]